MDEKSLKSEIRKCRKFARKGAKLSREQLKKLSITLDEAKTNIDKTLINLNNSSCYLPEVSESLSEQLRQTKNSFDRVSSQLVVLLGSYCFPSQIQVCRDHLTHLSPTKTPLPYGYRRL